MIEYLPTQNSNSYVNTILSIVGIELSNIDSSTYTPDQVNWFPGEGTNVLRHADTAIDLSISGTSGSDVIRTGLGNDTLSTVNISSSHDILSGGGGRDAYNVTSSAFSWSSLELVEYGFKNTSFSLDDSLWATTTRIIDEPGDVSDLTLNAHVEWFMNGEFFSLAFLSMADVTLNASEDGYIFAGSRDPSSSGVNLIFEHITGVYGAQVDASFLMVDDSGGEGEEIYIDSLSTLCATPRDADLYVWLETTTWDAAQSMPIAVI